MKKHIPNSLTILRVLLVPVFVWFAFFCKAENCLLWATIVFILASTTDLFDGLLARQFNVVSNFGKIMDPLADKLLIVSALFAIIQLGLINLSVVLIIIFREIFISILRNYQVKRNVYIPANIWGKLKTIFQMIGIITALVYSSIFLLWFPVLGNYSIQIQLYFKLYFWFVALITIFSGISYLSPAKN